MQDEQNWARTALVLAARDPRSYMQWALNDEQRVEMKWSRHSRPDLRPENRQEARERSAGLLRHDRIVPRDGNLVAEVGLEALETKTRRTAARIYEW